MLHFKLLSLSSGAEVAKNIQELFMSIFCVCSGFYCRLNLITVNKDCKTWLWV